MSKHATYLGQRSFSSIAVPYTETQTPPIGLPGPLKWCVNIMQLECGPMPNVMAALPNIGGALCSMPQSLDDEHY